MGTLIVFYSLDGNTKFIAEVIAKELQADLIELRPSKAFPSSGFKKYFWGGKSVLFKEQPELLNSNINLSNYDNIIIGTPIWAGNFSAPINTFVNKYKFIGKNVALFACHGGGGAKKCFENLRSALAGNQFIGEADFVDPLSKAKEENSQKAISWAKSLMV